ncbi:AAA family ATPase [Kitasatospora sp. NPDC048540]|uniref:AAA family ATPase n=1 Tax=Kitasatospora sp. NPDC048540 TaxID=3155634 RepID=UPI0033D5CD42
MDDDTGLGGGARLFVGRVPELAVLDGGRARAAAREPCLVVVEGEAGIGKTALVQRALADGPDGLVAVWARCDRSERDWPYSALDQWLRRLPPGTEGLTDLAALMRHASAAPLVVGQALLAVLAAVSEEAPLALVVDDAPWADEQSVAALGFVLRRLWSERVLVVMTARTGSQAYAEASDDGRSGQGWRGLSRGVARSETVRLAGLGRAEVGELARARTGAVLRETEAERLMERTGGHPLHLRTLLRQVTANELTDVSRPLQLPVSLETAIRHQLETLPGESRRLVEALAVLNTQVPLAVVGHLAGITPCPGPGTSTRHRPSHLGRRPAHYTRTAASRPATRRRLPGHHPPGAPRPPPRGSRRGSPGGSLGSPCRSRIRSGRPSRRPSRR